MARQWVGNQFENLTGYKGRKNNTRCNNNHNHNDNHKFQTQAQTFANNQIQQTVSTQRFLEQVDDTVLCISLAGDAYKKQNDDETINLLCDAAVVSLNMFAVGCEHLHGENNKDALDLGRKRAQEKLSKLQFKNPAVYKLIEPHREFINKALNGHKNLRYNEDRVIPGEKKLFEHNPNEINKAYGAMIQNQQKFDKRQQQMADPEVNRKLAQQHQLELNQYRSNPQKYQSKSSNKARPKLNDLYFTKSGKKSQFIDTKAINQKQAEEKAMDEDIYGADDDIYDKLLPKLKYMNAVLKLSKKRVWNKISYPIPCQILIPDKKDRATQDKQKVVIKPCYPWNVCSLFVDLDLLELKVSAIKKTEKKHIKKLQQNERNVNKRNLGYESIEQQDADIDNDGDINIY